MLIVKPYGRSAITKPASGESRRVLRKRDGGIDRDFKEFCREHPDLVLAQWISVVDKIARKPSGRGQPPEAQRKFRQEIGAVLWPYLTSKEILSPELKQKFWSKVHPYPEPDGKDKPRKAKPKAAESHPKKTGGEGKPEGRWYKRFLGDAEPDNAVLSDLPDKIFAHLYETEYRIAPTLPNKSKGLIAARAGSISGNLLQPSSLSGCGWTEADEEAYARGGNVATEIKRKIKELEAPAKGKKPQRASMRDVAPVLFGQYGRLFHGENDTALSVAEAEQKHPGLLALHQAVKEAYKRRLSGHKSARHKSVANVLPDSMDALFRLVHSTRQNARISDLIRIGKIAHYEAAPKHIVDDWPADRLDASFYWTSDGQAEIKRTDAFVRVWRTALAHAALTLADWADPEGRASADILTKPGKREARAILEKALERDSAAFDRKASVLFGNRAQDMKSLSLEKKKECWPTICEAVTQLRHSNFHFKGIDGFVQSINDAATGYFKSDVLIDLYKQDHDARLEYLVKTLQGVKADRYLYKEQFTQLIREISARPLRILPLPRFQRVLVRYRDAFWSKELFVVRLPVPANRQEMEEYPAHLCRYACLRLLYERAFPVWLKDSDTGKLKSWIDRAVERATSDAQKINKDELAIARAAHVAHLHDGDTIAAFLDRLAAETATEIRVQKGYDPDPEAARKKSAYLDNLNCDVILQAFGEFLNEKKFRWLLALKDEQENKPPYDLPELPPNETGIHAWQRVLYVILHLVPVGEVSRLLHQLQKWNILTLQSANGNRSGQPDAASSNEAFDPSVSADRLFEVLTLYLDMHDAKFEGGKSLGRGTELPRWFESEQDCKKIFPEQDATPGEAHLPLRGLREMQRFGALKCLESVFKAHRITGQEVSGYLKLKSGEGGESDIVRAQKARETLHMDWIGKPQDFDGHKKRDYWNALATVTRYRHLANRVHLIDHVQLYYLLMQILGRMVDFAGLWERDLYFTALGLMIEKNARPSWIFMLQGSNRLKQGRIVDALREIIDVDAGREIKQEIEQLFDVDFTSGAGKTGNRNNIRLRNNFMHFNMLRSGRNPDAGTAAVPLNLTALINDCRSLMGYDRKLKNAVSKSVKDLCAREKLDLCWKTDHKHCLTQATVKTKQARHLKTKCISENLCGIHYIKMVADLFAGGASSNEDVTSKSFDEAEQEKQKNRPKKREKNTRQGGQRRR